ncbi:hypothetical protein EON81_04170 [bacterium]|nr:MAG: hypothetical protein EON81_04170 [bacterium]
MSFRRTSLSYRASLQTKAESLNERLEGWQAQMHDPAFRMRGALGMAAVVAVTCILVPQESSLYKSIGNASIWPILMAWHSIEQQSKNNSGFGAVVRIIGLTPFLYSIKIAFAPLPSNGTEGPIYLAGIIGLGIFVLFKPRLVDDGRPLEFFGVNLRSRIGFKRSKNR